MWIRLNTCGVRLDTRYAGALNGCFGFVNRRAVDVVVVQECNGPGQEQREEEEEEGRVGASAVDACVRGRARAYVA